MGRSPCCDKSKVKRGSWSPEEDATLKDYLYKHGTAGNWIALPHKAGLQRCGKSCRLRWFNYLRPGIKHGAFTQDEQNIISNLYNTIGSRWSVIASHLPGRTDNDVKNYWNTKMRKKLNMPANSNTKTATDVAVAATCTTTTTVILDKATNFQASTDLLALPPTFPIPFSHNDNFNLPRSIFEGCSSNYSSDNSLFRPFSLGMDEKYGVDNMGILMDECSSYDNNADLFSIFNNETELRRMSQNH